MAQLDYPIRPNAKGGFDILLKPTLTAAAVSETATPPDMLEEDRATREIGGPGAGWVDQIGQIGATGDSRAQYTPSPMPPDMGGGPLGKMLPAGMSDTLAGVAGGMNTIDRNQSPLAGFAAGMAGAMTTRENRRESKRKEMLEAEERQWRQEDRLYNRGIEGEKLGMLREEHQRAGKAEQRDELADLANIQVKQAELKKVNIELERLANSRGLTVDQGLEAVKQGVKLTEREWTNVDIDDDDKREAYKQSLIRNTNSVIDQLTQAVGGGGTVGQAGAAGAAGGTGTSATDPVQWTPGQSPKTEAEFISQADAAVAANGGNPVYIKNPKTGQVGLYPAAAR